MNLALYRGGRSLAWVMTEYDAIDAREGGVRVGGSSLERDGAGWRIRIDERSANFGQPVMARFGRRVVGEIRVEPLAAPLPEQALVAGGATHAWQVLAPRARVSASFPGVGFRGEGIGYHDRNHGDARLDDGFSRWGWARFHGEDTTHVLYSMTPREGGRRALWVSARDDAPAQIVEARALPEGASMRLPYGMALPSRFGVERDPPASPLACEPTTLLEEAPFYARYRARLVGAPASEGIGEQLDLDRFRSRWTQFLVGFKTRRA